MNNTEALERLGQIQSGLGDLIDERNRLRAKVEAMAEAGDAMATWLGDMSYSNDPSVIRAAYIRAGAWWEARDGD